MQDFTKDLFSVQLFLLVAILLDVLISFVITIIVEQLFVGSSQPFASLDTQSFFSLWGELIIAPGIILISISVSIAVVFLVKKIDSSKPKQDTV